MSTIYQQFTDGNSTALFELDGDTVIFAEPAVPEINRVGTGSLEELFRRQAGSIGNHYSMYVGGSATGYQVLYTSTPLRKDAETKISYVEELLGTYMQKAAKSADEWGKYLAALYSKRKGNGLYRSLTQNLAAIFKKMPYQDFAQDLAEGMILAYWGSRLDVLLEDPQGLENQRMDAPTPEWLKLPFLEAIAYFQSKIVLPIGDYSKINDQIHNWAFMIAKVENMKVLEQTKILLQESLRRGTSEQVFQRQLRRIGRHLGYTPDGAKMRRIFQTNIFGAIGMGREAQMRVPEVLERRPYWIIRPGDSPNPRETHAVLDNKAIRADHPFWSIAGSPPWGFFCFPGEVKVSTPQGLRRIDSLQIGDLVVGGDGDIHPVTATHSRFYVGDVVEVYTEKGLAIKATPNHRVLTTRGWITAGDLKRSDVLVKTSEISSLNQPIRDVDKLDARLANAQVPFEVTTKGITSVAFESSIDLWDEQINPPAIDVVVKVDSESHRFQVSFEELLVLCWQHLSVDVSLGVCSEQSSSGGVPLFSNVGSKKGAIRFQLLGKPLHPRTILLGLTLLGMPMVDYIFCCSLFERLGSLFSARVIVNPLISDGLASCFGVKPTNSQQLGDGCGAAVPELHELSISQPFSVVSSSQDFFESAFINSFNLANSSNCSPESGSHSVFAEGWQFEVFNAACDKADVDSPPQGNLPFGHRFIQIESPKDKFDGAPLQFFDSLDDFNAWAVGHAIKTPIQSITRSCHADTVYDICVVPTYSYNLEQVTVHNCRHKIFAANERFIKERGIEVLDNPPDPYTIAEPGFRKGLLDVGNRTEILNRAIQTLSPEGQQLVREANLDD